MEQEDRKVGRFEDGTEQVIGALIEVHRTLGPGLLESVWTAAIDSTSSSTTGSSSNSRPRCGA